MFGLVSPTLADEEIFSIRRIRKASYRKDLHCVNPAMKVLFPGIEFGSAKAKKQKQINYTKRWNACSKDAHSYKNAAIPLLSLLTKVLFYIAL